MTGDAHRPGRRAGRRAPESDGPPGHKGVYSISVASELTGVEPHMLRAWEKAGLLSPVRSGGGTRRYSGDDLARLRHIRELASEGVNLPGIRTVLRLEEELARLRDEIDRLRDEGRSVLDE